jgi:peptidoglycan/xylan/chitin deacetylase (PgdA/CDA1 family)
MHTQQDNPFGILMYHRVTPHIPGLPRPTWNVAPERFGRQLKSLLSRGWRPWPLRRVLECRGAGEPLPARTFVITFDDGYQNVYHHAWPILKELAIPATVFLVTSYLDADCPFSFDDWSAAGSAGAPAMAWQPLSTVQCAEMLDSGLVELGSHTHTHDLFRGRTEAFRRDLARSLDVLRDAFGVRQTSFAFPFGSYDSSLLAAAHEAGVLCALTADEELVAPHADPFRWDRFRVAEGDTTLTLLLKLNGWYSPLRRAWRWLRRPRHADHTPVGQVDDRPQAIEKRTRVQDGVILP